MVQAVARQLNYEDVRSPLKAAIAGFWLNALTENIRDIAQEKGARFANASIHLTAAVALRNCLFLGSVFDTAGG